MRYLHILLLITLPLVVNCSVLSLSPDVQLIRVNDDIPPLKQEDQPILTPVEVLSYRANQMTGIQWTPSNAVPTQGGFFSAGETVTGIPYSSVKEMEKYVGQYISFYTFMTAVANPKSVLYTENVKQAPYHGTNCSTYYGTVCSMSVNYVLGIPFSYTTAMYKQLDCFSLVSPQSIDVAKPGDILLQENKHVVMIYDVVKANDVVVEVYIFESTGGRGTRIQAYSRDKLLERWLRDGWELLRYNDLNSITDIQSMAFNDYPYDTAFHSHMCCNRGDRATFREGEEIILNNLDGRQYSITVFRDNNVIEMVESDGVDISFSSLSPGIYTFDLSNPQWDNPSVEVLETTVSAERSGDILEVSFSSCNGKPMSVIISNLSGNHYLVQPITDAEREAGHMTVPIPNRSGQMYLKMMFEGKYGSTMNEPIAI